MRKMMTAITIAAALGLGVLGAAAAAQADSHSSASVQFDGYPDWANTAFQPKGSQ